MTWTPACFEKKGIFLPAHNKFLMSCSNLPWSFLLNLKAMSPSLYTRGDDGQFNSHTSCINVYQIGLINKFVVNLVTAALWHFKKVRAVYTCIAPLYIYIVYILLLHFDFPIIRVSVQGTVDLWPHIMPVVRYSRSNLYRVVYFWVLLTEKQPKADGKVRDTSLGGTPALTLPRIGIDFKFSYAFGLFFS